MDVWGEDDRTDRAIELLRWLAAKTNAEGRVVARHRYSRSFRHVAPFLVDIQDWRARSEVVRISTVRDPDSTRATVTVEIDVQGPDGRGWSQTGVVTSDEASYDWHALAACRALLSYVDHDDQPMTPDAVFALLEAERASMLAVMQQRSRNGRPEPADAEAVS
jgi:hypothetical protein